MSGLEMTTAGVIKQIPPKDLKHELNEFVSAANSAAATGNQSEIMRRAFVLLKTVPSSKDAVFEVLAMIVDRSTVSCLKELEDREKQITTQNPTDLTIIDEIHKELCLFIMSQPVAWSLLLSKWSCEQLGILSSKYSSRGRNPVSGSLNDSLQQWLSCKPTKILIDIGTQCINRLKHSDAGSCVEFLLDICVKNSPHCDWAVAYLGSIYPEMVITRVLKYGLHDFTTNGGNINSPKFKAVGAILNHLNGCHQNEITNSLYSLYKWSLEMSYDRDIVLEKNSAVPFMLQLSSMSSILLASCCQVVPKALKSDQFVDLLRFGPDWSASIGTRQALLDLVIHLIISVTEGAELLFLFILEATSHQNRLVASVGDEILGLLVKELEILVRGSSSKVPFLESLKEGIENLFPLLLSSELSHSSAAVTMFSFIGQQQPTFLPKCVSYVLLQSASDDHLAAVVKLSQGYTSAAVLTPAISNALTNLDSSDRVRLWNNLTKLFKWEASGTLISLPILEAVYSNLKLISNLLCEETNITTANTIAELMKKAVTESKQQPNVQLSRLIVQATLSYFYMCLIESEGIDEMKGIRAINSILKKICQSSSSTRVFALREILESSLFRAPSVLFGAVPPSGQCYAQPTVSLMKENLKQGHSSLMGQKHSSVFHAGIIGSGKRKAVPSCPTPYDKVTHNTNLLLTVIKACCSGETNQETLEAISAISLQLVELISPDVMYNGLPWPEEDFCKVTVERDLSIRRIMDTVPVVWSLLSFIAHHRPALCYCSVILRAIVATLLSQWFSASQQRRGPGHNKSLIQTTTKIVQIMALGQLLPFPLTALSDVIPHIPPIQVAQILRDCIWNYMRDNVPSPAMFNRDPNGNMWRDTATSKPPKQYTETLRLIMLNNVATLGPLYNTLFVEPLSIEKAIV